MKNSFKHGWSLANRPHNYSVSDGQGYTMNPNRVSTGPRSEKGIVTSICNRISVDAASIDVKHVRLDDSGRYKEDMDTELFKALTLQANIDQTGRTLLQDIVLSMLDEGHVAIVPTKCNIDPSDTTSWDVREIRTAQILRWYPKEVEVRIYNDDTGNFDDLVLPKSMVGIVENPLYAIMNESNSNMQRLKRKLELADKLDEEKGSGKLDMIIQLPYATKNDHKRMQAEDRRGAIEQQLSGSKFGIGYIDSTEKVIQLNRSLDNNIHKEVEYLIGLVMSQIGLTQAILDGTADENTMNNYFTRVIEPILSAICDELTRKFLSKTAITQKQVVAFFRDPFKLLPITQVAEIADKFTRNEIASSNEVRQAIGMLPSKDPAADELRNKNLSQSNASIKHPVNQNEDKKEDSVDEQ